MDRMPTPEDSTAPLLPERVERSKFVLGSRYKARPAVISLLTADQIYLIGDFGYRKQ